MKVHIVWVTAHYNGMTVARWMDSQWVEWKSAKERLNELENAWRVFRCLSTTDDKNGCRGVLMEATVADARITEPAKGDA